MGTPKPIKDCVVSENELIVPMKDVIHHDIGKLFHLQPDLLSEMKDFKENHPEAGFEAVIKYGMYSGSLNSGHFVDFSYLKIFTTK